MASDADRALMEVALEQARAAAGAGDVPVGAVVARGDEVLARSGNAREQAQDPTAHAEILALRRAAVMVGSWHLEGCTMYVTLEPCAMCAGAISLARVPRLVYGATDPKGGATGGVIDLFAPPSSAALNHRPEVEGGLLASESAALLEAFFSDRR